MKKLFYISGKKKQYKVCQNWLLQDESEISGLVVFFLSLNEKLGVLIVQGNYNNNYSLC